MNGFEPAQGDAVQARPPVSGPSTADLARSVRNLKRWMIALSVLVALMIVGILTVVGVTMVGFLGMASTLGGPTMPTEQSAEKAQEEIKSALGERLDTVNVRLVTVDYGDAPPFPFLLAAGIGDSKSLYVEYRLKDSRTTVAGLIEGPLGMDVSSAGLLPTRGSLASRMSDEQFEKILSAYAEQTKSPFGSVRRYSDETMMFEGRTSSGTVSVGSKEYPSKELWAVTEGVVLEGDRVNMREATPYERKSLVFHEDPKTGEFTYLGSEPAMEMGG